MMIKTGLELSLYSIFSFTKDLMNSTTKRIYIKIIKKNKNIFPPSFSTCKLNIAISKQINSIKHWIQSKKLSALLWYGYKENAALR